MVGIVSYADRLQIVVNRLPNNSTNPLNSRSVIFSPKETGQIENYIRFNGETGQLFRAIFLNIKTNLIYNAEEFQLISIAASNRAANLIQIENARTNKISGSDTE